jgi:hypothetical protein
MSQTTAPHRFPRNARLAALALAMFAGAPPALAAPPVPQPVMTENQLLAQAIPDECFNGLGEDYPPINPDGSCTQGQPKANQSYIWGLTEESGKLWFGTLANAACILDGLGDADPIVNGLFTCEFGQSQYARTYPAIPGSLGDWRPPRIYSWDLATHELVERKPKSQLLRNTLGFRGAGSIDDIAFLGGPALSGNGVNIFAFRASTGQFLGACTRSDYTYIRGWREVDGVLYVGVGADTHGAVLRWNGSPRGFAAAGNFCSRFSEVGRVTADVANITTYVDGTGLDRLAASTVPIRTPSGGSGEGTGIWISPPIPSGGLRSGNADQWRQVWSPSEYDPDPIVSRFGYAGGAVQYFDGWLYWGTIHLQNSKAYGIHETCTKPYCYGMPANEEEEAQLSAGVYRTTSVWRGRNLEDPATREVQLLYGESQLPACCSAPKTFEMRSTGWTPLYGPSGFGNPGNEYTWQMAVQDGHLFVGTYDASILQGSAPAIQYGADLWRFDSSDSPAVNENYAGLGDRLNYGIRILHPLDDGSGLIAGMANPFNLAPGGGWELRLLKQGAATARKAKPKR